MGYFWEFKNGTILVKIKTVELQIILLVIRVRIDLIFLLDFLNRSRNKQYGSTFSFFIYFYKYISMIAIVKYFIFFVIQPISVKIHKYIGKKKVNFID